MSVVTPIDQPEPSSRERLNRWLFRIALLVLAIGTVVFLYAVFHDSTSKGPLPAVTLNGQRRVPAVIEPGARSAAGKFILTAVARKNLASSWPLVHPTLRQGYTKAEWLKGDIPVQYFPVGKLEQVRFRVDEKTSDGIVLEVALVPNEGAGFDPTLFYIGLKKVGSGEAMRWLVDYWMPHWTPSLPKNPG